MATVAGVRLFEQEPDLLRALPEADRERAERFAVVPAVHVQPGSFDPRRLGQPRWGALILDGLVAREITVAGTAAAELLGAGDVVVPGGPGPDEILTSSARWTVLEPLHIAVLDDHFHVVVRHWPQIATCLLERVDRRATRLSVAQAISHLTRVDTRVLVMLWTLAGRWGRVGPGGVTLPLRLTHRTLARLVGARRPSVTTAISELARRDLVVRHDDGSWLLRGPAPQELERVGMDPILPAPAPGRRSGPVETEHVSAVAALRGTARPETREVSRRLQATIVQVRQLAEAYETQAERTRAIAGRTRDTRNRARMLRSQIAAERRQRTAPPPR